MPPLRRLGSRVKRALRRMLSRRVPARLARRFLPLPPRGRQELLDSIKSNYLTGWRGEQHYAPSYVEYLLADHLHTGLDGDRSTVIPWLDGVRRLGGLRVLDIGCGTGSSTVALAEQGARVTAIDIDPGALQVARDRCRIYGLEVNLSLMNANAIAAFGGGVSFHEFDPAVKPARELKVVGAMNSGWLRGLFASGERRRYKAMLRSLCPGIHEGFFDPTLELVIRRD